MLYGIYYILYICWDTLWDPSRSSERAAVCARAFGRRCPKDKRSTYETLDHCCTRLFADRTRCRAAPLYLRWSVST